MAMTAADRRRLRISGDGEARGEDRERDARQDRIRRHCLSLWTDPVEHPPRRG